MTDFNEKRQKMSADEWNSSHPKSQLLAARVVVATDGRCWLPTDDPGILNLSTRLSPVEKLQTLK